MKKVSRKLLNAINKNHKFCKSQSTIFFQKLLTFSSGTLMICLIAFWTEYTEGMLKLEDHDCIAWLPVENLLCNDMTEADHTIRDALVRLFLNLE